MGKPTLYLRGICCLFLFITCSALSRNLIRTRQFSITILKTSSQLRLLFFLGLSVLPNHCPVKMSGGLLENDWLNFNYFLLQQRQCGDITCDSISQQNIEYLVHSMAMHESVVITCSGGNNNSLLFSSPRMLYL
ncbi:hypothetical protein TNCV_144081 [Trichonephila clavipes]|nr:hypothetical protein TNCV_144081 [Trichonephila clavipes]